MNWGRADARHPRPVDHRGLRHRRSRRRPVVSSRLPDPAQAWQAPFPQSGAVGDRVGCAHRVGDGRERRGVHDSALAHQRGGRDPRHLPGSRPRVRARLEAWSLSEQEIRTPDGRRFGGSQVVRPGCSGQPRHPRRLPGVRTARRRPRRPTSGHRPTERPAATATPPSTSTSALTPRAQASWRRPPRRSTACHTEGTRHGLPVAPQPTALALIMLLAAVAVAASSYRLTTF